jgi:hypothetical protein
MMKYKPTITMDYDDYWAIRNWVASSIVNLTPTADAFEREKHNHASLAWAYNEQMQRAMKTLKQAYYLLNPDEKDSD